MMPERCGVVPVSRTNRWAKVRGDIPHLGVLLHEPSGRARQRGAALR
jgi:hypothetical protein